MISVPPGKLPNVGSVTKGGNIRFKIRQVVFEFDPWIGFPGVSFGK
jgi:hypothetical protein